ncbi:hypothetical protein UlMin_034485 [Ulmus minor]
MNPKASSSLLSLSLFLVLVSSATAIDITKLLGQHKDFSTFNNYLTQTKLNEEINRRQSITVLAVDNSAISSLSGMPLDEIKRILSVHVVLDYYDVEKITKLGIANKTASLTTLFQASGLAQSQQGFLTVALVNEGEIAFGDAAKGGDLSCKLVQSVAAQPYNISVLQITSPIKIPGIDSAKNSSRPSSAPIPSPKKSAAKAPKAEAPAASSQSKAPAPSDEETEAPETNSPATAPAADAPATVSPLSSDAEAHSPKSSGASTIEMVMGAGMVMGLVSFFVSL